MDSEGVLRISKRVARGVAALMFLIILVGCGPSAPSFTPGADEILGAFEAKALPETPVDSLPPLKFYLDSSMSMRGFVSYPGSRYTEVLQNIWRRIVTARYEVRAIRFSGGFTPLGNVSVSQFARPEFYSGKDTPLADLLKLAAADIGQGQIVAVVSDMVQSQTAQSQLDLVRELLRAIAQNRPELLVLGFRSSFRGDYYVESPPKTAPIKLDLPEGGTGRGRPFYVLVFAPSRAALETFQRYVLTGLGEEISFQPTLAPLMVNETQFVPPGPDAPQVWGLAQVPEYVATRASSAGFINRFIELQAPQGESSEFRVRFTTQLTQLRIAVASPSRFRLTIDKVSFEAGRPKGKPAPAAGLRATISLYGKPDDGAFVLTYSALPRPNPETWDVYRVQVQAGAGNLLQPDWVLHWSTPDDHSAATGNRTLHFDVLVEAMVRAITENVILFDHFVAFGRGA